MHVGDQHHLGKILATMPAYIPLLGIGEVEGGEAWEEHGARRLQPERREEGGGRRERRERETLGMRPEGSSISATMPSPLRTHTHTHT